MTKSEALKILDALADGCDPTTGEVLKEDIIFADRKVIRALQMGIDAIDRSMVFIDDIKEEISEEAIREINILFDKSLINLTIKRTARFLCGIGYDDNDLISGHRLYGSYRDVYKNTQLEHYLKQFENLFPKAYSVARNPEADDFFSGETYNKLSEKAIEQLKERINSIEIVKTEEDLLPSIVKTREKYPRSHEPWSEEELNLLRTAIKYTNDIKFLSECFQRGENSIYAYTSRVLATE